jgi:hypothetical protein
LTALSVATQRADTAKRLLLEERNRAERELNRGIWGANGAVDSHKLTLRDQLKERIREIDDQINALRALGSDELVSRFVPEAAVAGQDAEPLTSTLSRGAGAFLERVRIGFDG